MDRVDGSFRATSSDSTLVLTYLRYRVPLSGVFRLNTLNFFASGWSD